MTRAPPGSGLGNRLAPARFVGFLAMLVLAFCAYRQLAGHADWRDAAAMAFDVAAFCFLLSLIPLLRDSSVEAMRRHAAQNDANRLLVLAITSLMVLVAMAAIGGELDRVRQGEGVASAKLVGTMLLVWLFANSVYALHYAHAFYARADEHGGDAGGLDFPETPKPNYADFAYFAFTLGMTFQTSDVTITAQPIRQIALLHCFTAFVFNIGVIAFTISVLGGSS